MAPLVTVGDLQTWLGQTLGADGYLRADAILTAVSSLVRSEAGRTWEGEPVPDDVAGVVKEVTVAIWHRPDSTVMQQSVGDLAKRYAVVAGLWLTATQKSIVGRYRAQQRGLWTLSTTRGDLGADTVYVPVVGTVTEFPWYPADQF